MFINTLLNQERIICLKWPLTHMPQVLDMKGVLCHLSLLEPTPEGQTLMEH